MEFELAPFALPADYGDGIVPLADVKAWVAIEDAEPEFDELLGVMRDAGVDMVERYCGVYLAEREGVVWTADCLPARLRLGVRPVTEITEVVYLDSDGEDQEIDVGTLRLGPHGEVLPKPGQSWPSGIAAGLQVTFTAGYAAGEAPPALIAAVKMFAAHLFENREAVVSGTISSEIPLGFKAQCAAYRMPVI